MSIVQIETNNGCIGYMMVLNPEQAKLLDAYAKQHYPKDSLACGITAITGFLWPIIDPATHKTPEFHVGDMVHSKRSTVTGSIVGVRQLSNGHWEYTVQNSWGDESLHYDDQLEIEEMPKFQNGQQVRIATGTMGVILHHSRDYDHRMWRYTVQFESNNSTWDESSLKAI